MVKVGIPNYETLFVEMVEHFFSLIKWRQFSNIIIYVKIVGKILDQHLTVWVFSNPGDKVQILVESTDRFVP